MTLHTCHDDCPCQQYNKGYKEGYALGLKESKKFRQLVIRLFQIPNFYPEYEGIRKAIINRLLELARGESR